ncbi:MAG: hypothetical protein WHS44_08850 [Fimbriimonadales bacterium]
MKPVQQLQAHYVVDADGNPVAVLLDIAVGGTGGARGDSSLR